MKNLSLKMYTNHRRNELGEKIEGRYLYSFSLNVMIEGHVPERQTGEQSMLDFEEENNRREFAFSTPWYFADKETIEGLEEKLREAIEKGELQ